MSGILMTKETARVCAVTDEEQEKAVLSAVINLGMRMLSYRMCGYMDGGDGYWETAADEAAHILNEGLDYVPIEEEQL